MMPTKTLSALALDIGGTKIAAGVVDRYGKVTGYANIATPHSTPRGLMTAVKQLVDRYPKLPLSIGVAGQVNHHAGRWRLSSHIIKTRPTIALSVLRKAVGRPVVVDNDAHCFTIAEARYGAGKKYKSFIGITWGTGIGGGLFLNNTLFRGVHNSAGEVGHLMIPRHKHTISWEHTCAGPQLASEYARLSGHRLTNNEIIKQWLRHERIATTAVTTIANRFGVGLATLANIINPEAIIVGGGFGSVPGLLKLTAKSFRQNALNPTVATTRIVSSKLKKHAVLIGAAALQQGRFRL